MPLSKSKSTKRVKWRYKHRQITELP